MAFGCLWPSFPLRGGRTGRSPYLNSPRVHVLLGNHTRFAADDLQLRNPSGLGGPSSSVLPMEVDHPFGVGKDVMAFLHG